KCNDAAVFFGNRAQSAVTEEQDRRAILMLSRHLTVAVCGTVRCYVALEEDAEARKVLRARSKGLRAAARAVFEKSVGRDPERFLVPELADEVSLDSLATLFHQAQCAGALDGADEPPPAGAGQTPAARVFETMRNRLYKSRWGWTFKPNAQALKEELRDATACIEETNRVLSLAEILNQAKQADRPALEVVSWFNEEAK